HCARAPELVERRRMRAHISIGAHVIRPQRIDGDEDEVRGSLRLRLRRSRAPGGSDQMQECKNAPMHTEIPMVHWCVGEMHECKNARMHTKIPMVHWCIGALVHSY